MDYWIEKARPEHIPEMIEFWKKIDGLGLGRSDEPWALKSCWPITRTPA